MHLRPAGSEGSYRTSRMSMDDGDESPALKADKPFARIGLATGSRRVAARELRTADAEFSAASAISAAGEWSAKVAAVASGLREDRPSGLREDRFWDHDVNPVGSIHELRHVDVAGDADQLVGLLARHSLDVNKQLNALPDR